MNSKRTIILLLISFILSLLFAYDYILYNSFRTIFLGGIFFIPFFVLLGIIYLENTIYQKLKIKPNNIARTIVYSIYIVIIQIFLMLYWSTLMWSQPYNSDRTPLFAYPVLLKRYFKETGYYFPAKIPQNAKDIVLSEYYDYEIGEFTIAFDIDTEYIKNEKQRLFPLTKRLIKSDKTGKPICTDLVKSSVSCEAWEYTIFNSNNEKNNIFEFNFRNTDIKTLELYILDEDHINRTRGFGVNKNRIIYFYIR